MGILVLIAVLGSGGRRVESAPAAQSASDPVPLESQPEAPARAAEAVTPAPRISDTLEREAFVVSARVAGRSHIFAHLPGDPKPYQLTSGEWDDRDPVISPNMDLLAFASRRSGSWDLFMLDLESGQIRQLTDTAGYEGKPTWSPDGQWLAYEAYYDGDFDIWILPLDSAQPPIQLTNHPGTDIAPTWDPGGRRIAFVSDRDGSPDLILADLDKPTDRFINLTETEDLSESDPAFNQNGTEIAYGVQIDGINGIQRLAVDQPNRPPIWVGQGSDPVWSSNGHAISGILETPYAGHIVTYPLDESILPFAGTLSGRITELHWSPRVVSGLTEGITAVAEPLWVSDLEKPQTQRGRLGLVPLTRVNPGELKLSDAADEAFDALRERALTETGWDFLANLQQAFVGINDPLPPGYAYNDWLYTGRAFAISQAAIQAGWVETVREDFGLQTYWRVYVRATAQDGSLGEPLKAEPWDYTSRYIGDPTAYDSGGAPKETIPVGYYVDFTALAADYGFQRVPALPNWRSFYPGARFDEFALKEGLDWTTAMKELYPDSAIATPTPYQTPTQTPTNTPRPTPTPWWWRWRTPTPTLEVPTSTPTP